MNPRAVRCVPTTSGMTCTCGREIEERVNGKPVKCRCGMKWTIIYERSGSHEKEG